MKQHICSRLVATCIAATLFTAAVSTDAAERVPAQPTAATTQATPRTPWGTPDLTGVWVFVLGGKSNPAAAVDLVHGPPEACINIAGLDAVPAELMRWPGSLVQGTADGEVPYKPWARAKRDERLAKLQEPPSEEFVSASGRCLLYGMPATQLRPNPHVYQFSDHILMLWEYPQMHRIIWTDGRSPPPPEVRLWQGFSVGHWDGDTLIVKTTNQNGFPWLDGTGNVMSENTTATEYIKVVGPATIAYKVVVEDPVAYTKPWWMEWDFNILKAGAPLPPPPPGFAGAAPPGPPPGAGEKEKVGSYGLPTDINAFNAMMTGDMLEVACVEGQRHRVADSIQAPAPTKQTNQPGKAKDASVGSKH